RRAGLVGLQHGRPPRTPHLHLVRAGLRLAAGPPSGDSDPMMPTRLPRILRSPVLLRPFEEADADLVRSVADDPLIPLITTVPTTGSTRDTLAYIGRQHARLRDGQGYSFA